MGGVAAYAVTGDPDSYSVPTVAPTLVAPADGGTIAMSKNSEGDFGWLLTFDPPPNDYTGVVGSWTCADQDCENPQEFLDRENGYFACVAEQLRATDPMTYEEYDAFFDAPEASKCRDDRPGSKVNFNYDNNTVFLPASRYQPGQTRLWIGYWTQGPTTDVVKFKQTLTSPDGDNVSEYRFANLQAGPALWFSVGLLDAKGNLPASAPPVWVWIIVAVGIIVVAAVVAYVVIRRRRSGNPGNPDASASGESMT